MINNASLRAEGKTARNNNMTTMVLAFLIYLIVGAIYSALDYYGTDIVTVGNYTDITYNNLYLVSIVFFLLLVVHVQYGFDVTALASVRGNNVPLSTMGNGFKRYGKILVAGLLKLIYTTLWTLLFIIPGIVAAYKYAMTYYILQDHPEMSGNQAIAASKKLMYGHKWELFVLHLSFLGWLILCALTLGILSFWVVPHIACTNAAFYMKVCEIEGTTTIYPTNREPGHVDSFGEAI